MKGATLILTGETLYHWDGIGEDTLSREGVSNNSFQNLFNLKNT